MAKTTTLSSKSGSKTIDGISSLLLENETIFVGIDVHKVKWHIALWSEQRKVIIKTWSMPSHPEGLWKILRRFQKHIDSVVYEAGPTGFSLAHYLLDKDIVVHVVSAGHIPQVPCDKDKSDTLDCRKLAEYAASTYLHPVYIPDEEEIDHREIYRSRDTCVREVRRTKQRIKSFLLFHGLTEPEGLSHWSNASVGCLKSLQLSDGLRFSLNVYLNSLQFHIHQLSQATKALQELEKSEKYQEKSKRIQEIPGVGMITTMAILLELLAPERFKTKEEVGKMLGLAPLVRSSGETRKEVGRNLSGNPRLRTALVEVAWQWIRYDPAAKKIYNRLLANRGKPQIAIVGVARKLGIIIWRMLTRGQQYQPELLAA
jgi:transposase